MIYDYYKDYASEMKSQQSEEHLLHDQMRYKMNNKIIARCSLTNT